MEYSKTWSFPARMISAEVTCGRESANEAPCNRYYYLAAHVFHCVVGEHVVLLDLRRDKYLCIPRDRLGALPISLDGAPRSRRPGDAESADHPTLRAMLRQGLLSSDPNPSPRDCVTSTSPRVELQHERDGGRYIWNPSFLLEFVLATLVADTHLRYRPIEQTVHRVTARRRAPSATHADVNVDLCRQLVAAFERARPFYPRPYLCLFDSFAMLELLAHYRQYPLWVFGVQTSPFAAHCWLQAGDIVVNDTLDSVVPYTPIMTA